MVQARQEGPVSGGSEVQEALAELLGKIEALEQRTTDAALFLPPYDVRRAQEECRALRDKLDETRAASAPRKKFSFAAKRRQQQKAAAGDSTAGSGGGEGVEAPLEALSLKPQQPQQQSQATSGGGSGGGSEAAAPAMNGFEGREGEELDLLGCEPMGPELPKDLLLKDLRRCTIRL